MEGAETYFWEHQPGRKLAWSEFGARDGFPVIYCHGWPSSRLQAAPAGAKAADLGLRLIAADRPGMGRSDTVPGRRLADWPELVERFAAHLGIGRFAQLGVSGGAPYVLASAALIPDRVAVSSVLCGMVPLAFVDGGAKRLNPVYRLLMPFRKLPPAFLTPGLALLGASTRVRSGGIAGFVSSLVMPEKDRSVATGRPEEWKRVNQAVREGIGGQGNRGVLSDADVYFEDPGFDVENVAAPIRWWHGDEDRHIGLPLARALFDRLPAGDLEVVPGYGHFSLALDYTDAALEHIAAGIC